MKREITIRKNFIWLLCTLLIIGLTLFIIMKNSTQEKILVQPFDSETNDQVVINGLQAFLSPDYVQGYDVWVEQFCKVSSDSGCNIVKEVYGPAFWVFIKDHQFSTICTVKNQYLVESGEDYQVWQAMVHFSVPFPDQSSTKTVYALLVLQANGQWAFERVLTDQEAGIYE